MKTELEAGVRVGMGQCRRQSREPRDGDTGTGESGGVV